MPRSLQLASALILVVLIVAAGVAARSAQEPNADTATTATPSASPSITPSPSAPASPGAAAQTPAEQAVVIDFTTEASAQQVAAQGRDVVYFFSAVWCPDCQRINRALENSTERSKLDGSTTIVRVDYDKNTDLKRKYGVTYQTTFVRINERGEQIKKATLSSYDALTRF